MHSDKFVEWLRGFMAGTGSDTTLPTIEQWETIKKRLSEVSEGVDLGKYFPNRRDGGDPYSERLPGSYPPLLPNDWMFPRPADWWCHPPIGDDPSLDKTIYS